MYALRHDTLAGIKQSAFFLKRPLAGQPLAVAVKQVLAYEKAVKGKMAHPESEALKFYYANHVFSMIGSAYGQHEILPEPVADLARAYVKIASDLTVRLAYYCLLICTREARHMYQNASAYAKIKNEWGAPVSDFLKSIHNHGEMEAINKLRHSPPDTTVGQFISGLTAAFNTPGVWSGGYGGVKWGKVAETLRSMIYGETTAEMFSDTGFTLAHNGGPIFNKGMLYHHYDKGKLYKVLDVQRSGQIPQLWVLDASIRPDEAEFNAFVKASSEIFPVQTGGYVDWYKVTALGGTFGGGYLKEKQAQLAKHGQSPAAAEILKAEANKFWIAPGEYVTMFERKKAA